MAERDPKTKEELLDRMARIDYSGDLRDLAANRNLMLKRTKKHVLEMIFPTSGSTFLLTVRKPRPIKAKTTAKPVEGAKQETPQKAARGRRKRA